MILLAKAIKTNSPQNIFQSNKKINYYYSNATQLIK